MRDSKLLIGMALVGAAVALFSGPSKKKPPPMDDKPPPKPPEGDPIDEFIAWLKSNGVTIDDRREEAPKEYVKYTRSVAQITSAVLHQTAFDSWKPTNPLWAKVRSHFVVRKDGSIVINHSPTARMGVGSGHANKFGVTIEHEGNYPNENGKYWKPEKFGESKLIERPKLVSSGRLLLRALKKFYGITHVFAHRQWQAVKANCPGPDIWRAIGQWSVDHAGLSDGGEGWKYSGGMAISPAWRAPWP